MYNIIMKRSDRRTHLKFSHYLEGRTLPVTMTRMRYNPSNREIPMHDHDFSELVVVIRGTVKHIRQGGTDTLSAGDFFVIHPGTRHGYIDLSEDMLAYNLLYDGRLPLPQVINGKMQLIPEIYPRDGMQTHPPMVLGRLKPSAITSVRLLLDLLAAIADTRRKSNPEVLAHIFAAAIAEFSDAYSPNAGSSMNPIVRAAVKYINEHLDGHVGLDEIAHAVSTSKATLLRLFRDHLATSPGNYLLDARAALAEQLLKTTDKTQQEIAAICGFHDASHLAKTLIKRRGQAPGAIRGK